MRFTGDNLAKALVLDVENDTTVINEKRKKDMSPFRPENRLVQVGYMWLDGKPQIENFYHTECSQDSDRLQVARQNVQQALDECTVLIGHNIKHDLVWLWECGFEYKGPVFDTMLCEYVYCRANQEPLSLDECAERYELDHKKQDTLKNYFKQGYLTSEIPLDELSMYLEYDLLVTRDLFNVLHQRYLTTDNSLWRVIDLTMETCIALSRMYCAGIKVDFEALDIVADEFIRERNELQTDLQRIAKELMGDTPININSPEQLGALVYSRKPNDKRTWSDLFNPYMKDAEFRKAVKDNSEVVRKTKAKMCPECKGEGRVQKFKKDGSPFKNKNLCHNCEQRGYMLTQTKEVAGLKFNAPSPDWISASGFSTAKGKLLVLAGVARSKGMTQATEFLEKMIRLNAVNNYISTFVGGIKTFTQPSTGMLHVDLTQAITRTGRFSGRDPNMQNMPRGGTFPIKKVFVSRWEGGYIMEADFAQLEFRGAAFLAQDETAMKEVAEGFDVHAYTAKIITEAGQKTSRQDAKAHTFAPLYGATGHGRTPAEAAYYKHFTEKYRGIAKWHRHLAQQALSLRKIITPSGREFAFPDVKRRRDGTVTQFTNIKNYPVQSWATADCVPVALLAIDEYLQDMQSCIVNSVHDSIVIDIHPDEKDQVIQVINTVQGELHQRILDRFDVDFNVPLLLEPKIGPNWLAQEDC